MSPSNRSRPCYAIAIGFAVALFKVTPGLITEPVRSGTQIYARGGDLVVTASVSPGAELVADGNIHVYGALRGRAIAGLTGQAQSRIFCRKLEAELIAIDGVYRTAEDMEGLRGKAVQAWLEGESLSVTVLD